MADTKWDHHGIRVVKGVELEKEMTPVAPGIHRAEAITFENFGAERLWIGKAIIQPKAKTGAHHHGALESVIIVVSGNARMRWGDNLEFTAEAGPGDFIYVPPHVPHQEINASDKEPLIGILVRSDKDPVMVTLDIPTIGDNNSL
jgi:uncharacterized RmlC-like cupin family protein